MKAKAVFLDRDGTLIQERGHISVLGQVKFIKGAYTALRKLQNLGFKLIIVSNQSGVARGILTETEVQKVNRHILSELEKRAKNIKGKGVLVLTGYGKRELSRLNSRRNRPDFVARNLLQAVKWIASNAK